MKRKNAPQAENPASGILFRVILHLPFLRAWIEYTLVAKSFNLGYT